MTAARRARAAVLSRSVFVGLIATGLDLSVLFALIEGVGVAPRVANVPALLAGLGVQFCGNKYFAFRDRTSPALRQLAPFTAVEAVALALNAAAFSALTTCRLHFAWARLLGEVAVYLGFSLPCWHRIFVVAAPLTTALRPSTSPTTTTTTTRGP